ncbi:MAG TPA: SUMF1/EgtB/PvdO family nonheme iron enzyme [bacterium]|nr:SUMF1/EgtB/PvdO family nonheme iron enzyme [bacterium]
MRHGVRGAWSFFVLFIAVLCLSAALFAQEKKQKIAVMEFADKTAKLKSDFLGNAAEYLRSELAATNRYILISKERQLKEAVKLEKKESYRECYDKSCQLPLGQALSADTLVTGTITYFGGAFVISLEMIDLAKEATVKAAKAEFDGTEQGMKTAVEDLVSQLVFNKKLAAKKTAPDKNKAAAGTITAAQSTALYDKARDNEAADVERAKELYRDIVQTSDPSDRNYTKALERLGNLQDKSMYEKACEDGVGWPCGSIAYDHSSARNTGAAFKYFLKGCDQECGWCCYNAAMQIFKREAGVELRDAVPDMFAKGCELKDEYSCKMGKILGDMVSIPEGWFAMGCAANDANCGEAEKPAHKVWVSAFQIDAREVTNEEYNTCVSYGGCQPAHYDNGTCWVHDQQGKWVKGYPAQSFRVDSKPVVCVDRQQAIEYCAWLGKRLPTEAEWEKAARAGAETPYHWGTDLRQACTFANGGDISYHGRYPWDTYYNGECSDGVMETAPAGSYQPNAFGLYDMAGNAAELVIDWFDSKYYAASPQKDPRGPAQGKLWVTRGGSWQVYGPGLRSSSRSQIDWQAYQTGFRCGK